MQKYPNDMMVLKNYAQKNILFANMLCTLTTFNLSVKIGSGCSDLDPVEPLKADLYHILLVSMHLNPVALRSTPTCVYKVKSKYNQLISVLNLGKI